MAGERRNKPAEIGDVPSHWDVVQLSHYTSRITYGFTNPMPTTTEGPFMLTAKDVHDGRIDYENARRTSWDAYRNELTDKSRPRIGDVLLTKDGSIGRVALCDRADVCINQSVALLQPNEKIEPRFLKFLLEVPHYQSRMEGDADGTTIKHIYITRVDKMQVAVPPICEQRAIASVLGALDDKIELNRRMNETLEALAQSLFKSWFVDATQSALPKGWREGTLGDITGFLGGYAFKSKDWIEQGVPVVKIGSVKPGIVDLNQVSFVSDEVAAEAKRYRLCAGDLLIGMTGYVGEVGLVPPSDNLPLLNQRVGKFVLEKAGTAALGFLYCLCRRPEFKATVEVKSHGTAQANVSADGILSVPVTVPPRTLTDEFNAFCEPVLNRILANHAESRTLAALRDALLPKLLSGELRVSAAAKLTESKI